MKRDFDKSRNALTKLSKIRLNKDSKKYVLYNCLVFDGGRYREPGSKYSTLEKSRKGSVRLGTGGSSSRSASRSRVGLNRTIEEKRERKDSVSSFRSSLNTVTTSKRAIRTSAAPNLKYSFGKVHTHIATQITPNKPSVKDGNKRSVLLSKKLASGNTLTDQGSISSKKVFPQIFKDRSNRFNNVRKNNTASTENNKRMVDPILHNALRDNSSTTGRININSHTININNK